MYRVQVQPGTAGYHAMAQKKPVQEPVRQEVNIPVLPAHLTIVSKLGKGAYGEVYLCQDRSEIIDNQPKKVAIKCIRDFARDPLGGKRILREIRILAQMNHENVLNLVDILPVSGPNFNDVHIVLPFMDLDLHKAIYSTMVLSEGHVQAFIAQILRGLKYLHSAGIVHRDLKPANILVNQNCTLKIADMGLARGRTSADDQLTTYVVTRWYRAPELLLCPSGYFEAVDIWSVGCILGEIISRKPLFQGQGPIQMLRLIAAALGFVKSRDLFNWLPASGPMRDKALEMVEALQLPEQPTQPLKARLPDVSEDCLKFLHKLLTFDPTRRISARDAILDPYLAFLHDEAEEPEAPMAFRLELR